MHVTAGYVGDKSINLELFVTGKFQLVLISPESLLRSKLWRNILKTEKYQENLIGFIVDEAHLIKNW